MSRSRRNRGRIRTWRMSDEEIGRPQRVAAIQSAPVSYIGTRWEGLESDMALMQATSTWPA